MSKRLMRLLLKHQFPRRKKLCKLIRWFYFGFLRLMMQQLNKMIINTLCLFNDMMMNHLNLLMIFVTMPLLWCIWILSFHLRPSTWRWNRPTTRWTSTVAWKGIWLLHNDLYQIRWRWISSTKIPLTVPVSMIVFDLNMK